MRPVCRPPSPTIHLAIAEGQPALTLTKEAFTHADCFGVELPPKIDLRHKLAFLGAVFLIGFVHFEDKS